MDTTVILSGSCTLLALRQLQLRGQPEICWHTLRSMRR
ncbi:Uncharacterized protein EbC_27910 [Erwinia billingiae Eb661]|uniref:Uncharacterized protein n=1 Tax=Erwinia billingiae (strain Eb661) TaxID=634500 RepID=D8MU15_ERWBE|nr:Uncharacterized protein EbC_27910 [Erwinia billingiae Eb661]